MKQISNKKLTLLLILCFTVCLSLTGCMPSFDASGYIQACLDANTKGEFEAYAEITGSSIEEVQALYEQAIDAEMSYIDSYNVSEEKKSAFRDLFIEIYKSLKYEVGEATLNDDKSYTVPVTTYKLTVFDGIMAEAEEHLINYAQAEVDAGNTPSIEQLEAEAIDYMYQAMKDNLNAMVYAEPVTTDIIVSPSKDGSTIIYSADSSKLQALIESLIDIENAQ